MPMGFLGGGEILVAAIVGLLLFGGRLPDVAKDLGRLFLKARRTLEDIRRESGIDQTLREIEREAESARFSPPDLTKVLDRTSGPDTIGPPAEISPAPPEEGPESAGKEDSEGKKEPEN
ncbi:MAG: twin-arginine translocase TatA/TatE family subunit [Planctomycetota bacterium]